MARASATNNKDRNLSSSDITDSDSKKPPIVERTEKAPGSLEMVLGRFLVVGEERDAQKKSPDQSDGGDVRGPGLQ